VRILAKLALLDRQMGIFGSGKKSQILPEVPADEVEVVVRNLKTPDIGLQLRSNNVVDGVTELYAHYAGFKVLDRIVAIDGVAVKDLSSLKEAWNGGARARDNRGVTFTVLRIPKEGKPLPSLLAVP
jgi:C-terminal processing protease CtpA/Prc